MKKFALLAILVAGMSLATFAQVDSSTVQASPAAQVEVVPEATSEEGATADGPPKTSIYDQVINWYNANLNYGTVALLMAVESSFIPFPSELVVPPAAYKAMQPESGLNIVFIVLFATLGALAGAFINYFLAKLLGRPIVYKFADSRLGHFLLLDSGKVTNAERFFLEHGAISTLVGRLIPAIRQLISIPAGLSKMKLWAFSLYTAIGAIFWNIILAVLGYIAHGQKDLIQAYSHELSIGLVGLGVLFIGYMTWCALKPKK
ncbi:membrane protein DedA, SNARE-associated domain [Fibrobacter sp. UWT3]|nr:DedA family protein [Fibrobacter sp. UWT3]SOE78775.1 membrane protein DedA, SNARE-associated domain [Fibrobacter sp. UWT3]